MILTTPLIRAIRTVFPNASVTSVVIPQCAEIVSGWSDKVFTIDKKRGGEEVWANAISKIAKAGIGVAFVPHRSFRSGKLLNEAGIPVRIGFDHGGGKLFHSLTVPYPIHEYEGGRNLKLLKPFNNGPFDPLPELRIDRPAVEKVYQIKRQLKVQDSAYAVIAPASVWKTKAWPTESYRILSEYLLTRFGLETVAVGGPDDKAICGSAVQRPELNLSGELSPIESAELMRTSRFVISGDSAAAHLATSVRVRQVIIFGSTAPRFGFAPDSNNVRLLGLDMGCRPCTDHGRNSCPIYKTIRCMENISPSMVIASLSDWLVLNEETAINSVDNDNQSRYL